MKAICFGVAVLLLLAACTEAPKTGAHWREVGSIDSGFIRFVEVDTGSAQDGSVYKEAAQALMAEGNTWQIGFFLPGDAIPPSETRQAFFQGGGWKGYKTLATYMQDGFTHWDCERAGVADAPASALCGKGAEEQYDAIERIAARDGWVTACGLPPFDGRAIVVKYAAQFGEQKRAGVMQSYEDDLATAAKGPDDPADCQNLRARIMGWGVESKRVLVAATPRN